MDPLFFEDVDVGQVWVSPRRTVTESDVVGFAASTGDFNPLHVDFEYAAKSYYKKPIAHGLLGMSWVAGLGSQAPNMNTIAFVAVRDWEFTKPLYFGDTVYVHTECISREQASRRSGKICWKRRLIKINGEVTQEGIFETIVAMRNPVRRPHFLDRVDANRSEASKP